jgi:Na+-transporting methylmalonyl-CoA/oxaloacetate decarboxylase gamma subunit
MTPREIEHAPFQAGRSAPNAQTGASAPDEGQHVLSLLAGVVSNIGAVARNGPPDFHSQPTHDANFGMGQYPPSGQPPLPTDQPPAQTSTDQYEPTESLDPLDQETEPTEWYRKPVLLIAWALLVLILIALIVYGITELIEGGQGISPTPSPSTTPPTTTTTTTTTTTPPTTTTTTTPPTSSAVEPPVQQPTQQPTQQQPTHRHHLPQLPQLPWSIPIPEVPTEIPLPPGLR